jgi:hypothetical protein
MQQVFVDACMQGDVLWVRQLLSDPTVDPAANDSAALSFAVMYNRVEVVRMLIADGRADPSSGNNVYIRDAVFNGNAEVARVLLADSRVDPCVYNNWCIRVAIQGDHADILRALLAHPCVNTVLPLDCLFDGCARVLVEDERFGIEQHRDLYEEHQPKMVAQYDAALARGLTMAWVARGIRASYDARNVSGLPSWESLVEPVAKRLKAGFI